MSKSDTNRSRLGPHSRAIDRGSVGWSLDGRSREGRFLRAYEAMLVSHLGGKPSRVQQEMIRRCARLALHLELADEKALGGNAMSDHTARQYLAWHGALVRTLRQLGMTGATGRPPTLAELLASAAPHAPTAAPANDTANDTGQPGAPSTALPRPAVDAAA